MIKYPHKSIYFDYERTVHMIDFRNMKYGVVPYIGNNTPTDISKISYRADLAFGMHIGFAHGQKDDWCAWTWYVDSQSDIITWY